MTALESSTGDTPATPARPGIEPRRVLAAAAWLVAGAAVVQLIDGFLGGTPVAAAVLGAVAIDLLAGRAGVRWSATPLSPPAPKGEKRAAPWGLDLRAGAALGATAGMAIVAGGHALGWAAVTLGAPGLTLAFAVGRVGAIAARDELLLRWLPLALGRRAGVPDRALLAFAVVLAVAPAAASPAASAVGIALAAAQGLLGARLALATRGAIASAAAHAMLVMVLGPLSRGGVLDVTWWSGDPGPSPHGAGAAGWLAAAVIAALAVAAPRLVPRRSAGRTPLQSEREHSAD